MNKVPMEAGRNGIYWRANKWHKIKLKIKSNDQQPLILKSIQSAHTHTHTRPHINTLANITNIRPKYFFSFPILQKLKIIYSNHHIQQFYFIISGLEMN